MSTPTGVATGPALRLLEALPALVRDCAGAEGWRHAGALLEAAGALLRRRDAWRGGPDAERALAALERAPVQSWLSVLDAQPVHEALSRARHHASDAAQCEDPEEATLHAAEALAGLTLRDRLASQAAALEHWERLQGAGEPPPDLALPALHAAGLKTLSGPSRQSGGPPLTERLQARLTELDAAHRPHARMLVGVNAQRRAELALLDPGAREAAWWFGARSDCDGLWAALSGDRSAAGGHLEECLDCLSDLDDSATVLERSRPAHLDAETLWALEFDEAPKGERIRWAAHAADCAPCAGLLQAMQEGDAAILAAESLEDGACGLEEEGPDASGAPNPVRPSDALPGARARRPERTQLTSHEAFRLVLIRDRGRSRLLVQPSHPGAVLAASVLLSGSPRPLRARPTPEGLEFALGEETGLAPRTLQLQLTLEGGLRYSRDFAL